MPPTDVEEKVVIGFCNIVDALVPLQTLMGRATDLIAAWEEMERSPEDIPLPLIAYDVTVHREIGGAGDNRRITITCSCFAREQGASQALDPKSLTRHMVEALENGVTQPALAAQGLDAAVISRQRITAADDIDGTEGLHRSTIAFEIWVTK